MVVVYRLGALSGLGRPPPESGQIQVFRAAKSTCGSARRRRVFSGADRPGVDRSGALDVAGRPSREARHLGAGVLGNSRSISSATPARARRRRSWRSCIRKRPAPGAPHEHARIAGVDEAGRGPLAGPVVAAAVILPAGPRLAGMADSKAAECRDPSALTRGAIRRRALCFGIGWADAAEIDALNIFARHLSRDAPRGAGASVVAAPAAVDGNRLPRLDGPRAPRARARSSAGMPRSRRSAPRRSWRSTREINIWIRWIRYILNMLSHVTRATPPRSIADCSLRTARVPCTGAASLRSNRCSARHALRRSSIPNLRPIWSRARLDCIRSIRASALCIPSIPCSTASCACPT